MTLKSKLTLYFYFCFVKKLILSRISHCDETRTQTYHKITYKYFYFGITCYKVFGLKFSLYVKDSRIFDYIS